MKQTGAEMGRRRSWLARCAVLLVGALVASGATGCGGSPEPLNGPTTALRITSGFGHSLVWARENVPLAGRGTLLRQLRDEHTVRLNRYVPIVESIDGIDSNDQNGGGKDLAWVTQVNGIETDIAPPNYRLHPGDVVQWDLRDWYGTLDVRATVGAFPETFTRGVFGKRFPVRVFCEKPRSWACNRVKRTLRDSGVPLGQRRLPLSMRPPAGNPQRARVLVGKWTHWRDRKWPSAIDAGARDSGVFARFSKDARSLRLYDWNDQPIREEGAGTGLVASTRPTEEDLMWFVTGIDDQGVDRAVRALNPDTLRDAFALAVTDSGAQRLPLEPGE